MISEKMLELLCIYNLLSNNTFIDTTTNTYLALTTRRDELELEFVKYIEDKFNYKRKG